MAKSNDTSRSVFFGKHLRHVSRLATIVNVFARYGFWSVLERAGVKGWLTEEQARVAEQISTSSDADQSLNSSPQHISEDVGPQRLRKALEELGPAFVKLGQMLASREDLIPEAYTEELKKLHQNVAAVPFATVQRVLQEELGAGIVKLKQVEEIPLAAGSIGQVHRATLMDGREVVIKVQRPNIAESIKLDLSLMEVLASLIEKYLPESKHLRPRLIVEEFSRTLQGELDFVREAGNTAKVSHNFSGSEDVVIPDVIWDLSTTRVLTLSFLQGHALSNRNSLVSAGLDPQILLQRGLHAFLQMVFSDGLYHGDLHAGNLLALSANRIAFLDFGATIRLSRATRENLAGLLVALVEEDYEALSAHFVDLADPQPDFDLNAFEDDLANMLSPFVGLRLSKLRTGKLLWDIAKLAGQRGAPLPRPLIMFFKTLASFEGVGNALSPDFELITACQSFSTNLVKKMYSTDSIKRQGILLARDLTNLGRTAPRQVRGLLKMLTEGDLTINLSHREAAQLSTVVDRAISRLAVSVILASIIIGSSILILAKLGDSYQHMSYLGFVGFALAGFLGLYVVWSVFRSGRGRF